MVMANPFNYCYLRNGKHEMGIAFTSNQKASKKLKQALFREFGTELFSHLRLSRFVDIIDLLAYRPTFTEGGPSFSDLLHYYLRYIDADEDLVKVSYQFQVILFGTPPIDISALRQMREKTFQRCSVVNSQLASTISLSQLTSVTGPNPRREFISEVSHELERLVSSKRVKPAVWDKKTSY